MSAAASDWAARRSRGLAVIRLPGKPVVLPAGVVDVADDRSVLSASEWHAELLARFGFAVTPATFCRYIAQGWIVRLRKGPRGGDGLGAALTSFVERRSLVAPVLHRELRRLGLAPQHASWKMDEFAALLGEGYSVSAAWECLWPPDPHYTLCDETGRLAPRGVCPVHGASRCLREYAPVDVEASGERLPVRSRRRFGLPSWASRRRG